MIVDMVAEMTGGEDDEGVELEGGLFKEESICGDPNQGKPSRSQ